jgi:hypothetical protein
MRFWHQFTDKIFKLGRFLAKPYILFYALPWLMVIIILGTVAQKDMGLHSAIEKYFNSIILWLGPVPTPGGLSTIGIILIALSLKFIFFSPWRWEKAGTILTHLGVLLLLIGGIVTSVMSREGFIIIPEGSSVNAISNYQERVLLFKRNNQIIKEISFNTLSVNQDILFENFTIKILYLCNNCDGKAPSGDYKNLQGLAQNMELFSVPDEKNIEANFSGLIFEINSENINKSGTYIVMEDIPKNPELATKQGTISISLERQKELMPFSITLKDFRKIDYPGTLKAREFESDIIIHDGNLSWPVTISMNKPLRYKGYTFYQSSFEQRANIDVTVLSVVQNIGRIFPYISTLIIFMGLLLHLILKLQKNSRKRGNA